MCFLYFCIAADGPRRICRCCCFDISSTWTLSLSNNTGAARMVAELKNIQINVRDKLYAPQVADCCNEVNRNLNVGAWRGQEEDAVIDHCSGASRASEVPAHSTNVARKLGPIVGTNEPRREPPAIAEAAIPHRGVGFRSDNIGTTLRADPNAW